MTTMPVRATMSPTSDEIQALLCCARATADAASAARLATLLEGELDWRGLVAFAWRHRMLPLLYWHLNANGSGRVPPAILETLRREFRLNSRNSLLITGELRAIVALLDSHGIPAIAHKGPVLAEQLYGNVALREMLDLDIFVRRDDVLRARELLRSRGYRSPTSLSPGRDRSTLAAGSNFPLVNAESSVLVELHWRPEAHLSAAAVERLWTGAGRVPLAGAEIPTFGRDEQLVLLCMHGCRHMWERFEWLCGLAELVRQGGFSWPRLIGVAQELGGRRALRVGLLLIRELWQMPLPAEAEREVERDAVARRLATASLQHLFREHTLTADQLGLPFHLFQLRSRERLRHRLGYAYHHLLTPTKEDWAAVPLPEWLFPLYALARPVRLGWTYVTRPLRRAGSAETAPS